LRASELYVNILSIMANTKIVYALHDPRDGRCRYVGASQDPTLRLAQHRATGAPRVKRWLIELERLDLKPSLSILSAGTEDEWITRLSPDLNARHGDGWASTILAVTYRVSADERAELEDEAKQRGVSSNAVAKRRAFPVAVLAMGAALAIALIGCGAEPLPGDDIAVVAPGAPPTPAAVVAPAPSMVGVWVSETTGEVIDLRDGGVFHHVSAEGLPNDGTWSVVNGYLVTVSGGTGRQHVDGLTADRLTLAPGGVYDRDGHFYRPDPAPDCAPVKRLAGCDGARNAAGNYCFAADNADDSLPLPTACAVRHAGPNGDDAYVTSNCAAECSYGTVTPPPPPANNCDIPAGDTVVITSCPGTCKVCVSQNYAFTDIPPADAASVHHINLAGCALAGRPDLVCVTDCSAPCPAN
jgi:hypothetical protein